MDFFKKHKLLTIVLIVFSFYLYKNYTRVIEGNLLVDKNNIQYVNSLYMSDGMVYENSLNSDEKRMYIEHLKNVKNRSVDYSFYSSDYNCSDYTNCFNKFSRVHEAILVDHPELMSYATSSIRYENNKFTVKIYYATYFGFLEPIGETRIARIVDDIKQETKGMSDVEKVKYVYDWIGSNNSYDTLFTYQSKNQSIYNVFIKHTAVCAGFAKASQIIFQNIGIESYGVVGYSTGPDMWNIVKIDGKYYYYDSTVASGYNSEHPNYYDGLKQSYLRSFTLDHPNWYSFKMEEDEFL